MPAPQKKLRGSLRQSRGRPRNRTAEETMSRITALFWRKGYHATSLRDIHQEGGASLGALYSQYASKERLYMEALKYYRKSVVLRRREVVEASENAMVGIERFFSLLIEHAVNERTQLGCLNTNTCVELAGLKKSFQQISHDGFLNWKEFWLRVIRRGQSQKVISRKISASDGACQLIVLTQGINALSKAIQDRRFLEGAVDVALRSFRPIAKEAR